MKRRGQTARASFPRSAGKSPLRMGETGGEICRISVTVMQKREKNEGMTVQTCRKGLETQKCT